jgi:BirA family biotin operon repressor/biotin-[acetyl-CoA-carboxylase] ligase
VVLGIGVNLNSGPGDFPADLRGVATSLSIERGQPVPRALFAAALLAELEQWLDLHADQGFVPIRAAWRERSVTLGREVRADGEGGEITGVAEDIDETGALLVRARGGLVRVVAGDVRLVARVDPEGA